MHIKLSEDTVEGLVPRIKQPFCKVSDVDPLIHGSNVAKLSSEQFIQTHLLVHSSCYIGLMLVQQSEARLVRSVVGGKPEGIEESSLVVEFMYDRSSSDVSIVLSYA